MTLLRPDTAELRFHQFDSLRSKSPGSATRQSAGSLSSESLSLRRQAAVPAVALLEVLDGRGEVLLAEVGPENGGDVQLGVGGLPEQEVGDAHLAGGADHQVELRKMSGIEAAADRFLIDGLLAGGDGLGDSVDDLLPAAVIEREGQLEAGVALQALDGLGEFTLNRL